MATKVQGSLRKVKLGVRKTRASSPKAKSITEDVIKVDEESYYRDLRKYGRMLQAGKIIRVMRGRRIVSTQYPAKNVKPHQTDPSVRQIRSLMEEVGLRERI